MHFKSVWNYANKGLLAILSVLVIFSLASIIFVVYTLKNLDFLLPSSGSAISSAFVLQDLVINLQVVDSGPRGYVITGDKKFLSSYDESFKRVKADIDTLNSNAELDITDEQKAEIESLATKKLALSIKLVDARNSQSKEAAEMIVSTREDDDIMLRMQELVNGIATTRLQNLGPRLHQSQSNIKRSIVVAVAMAIFVLGTCLAVISYFQRSILRERALENTKSEFLSLASHQLRTPATNVKQYVGLLLDGYMGDFNDQQRHALMVAYKNNESEISIINNLLDVAKLDLNRIQLNKKLTNIVTIARHSVTENSKVSVDRKQTISLRGDKVVMAAVDAGHIKGVFDNLVDNAMKYSREGTNITVKVTQEAGEAVVLVKDQGLGIRKRDFTKLFNKFSRLDNDFSASSQGSGLGLYWVKQIVLLHGGTIAVASKEGRGSQFVIRLPLS